MANFGAWCRICSTQATPAMPLPTTTRFCLIGSRRPFQPGRHIACSSALVVRLAADGIVGAMRDEIAADALRHIEVETIVFAGGERLDGNQGSEFGAWA